MRRRRAEKRKVVGDPKYNSDLVSRFISILMVDGKKTVAENIIYNALDILKEKTQEESPVKALNKAVDNVRPRLEVKSRRVGGATYQVPLEVPSDRQMALAMRWLVDFADKRKGIPMGDALAAEIMDAYQGQGNAIRKRDDVHKMAQANKAFAHYKF